MKVKINSKHATILLAFSMFFTGACGLIYEYVLCAVSTYILGNSVEQFSIIIGLMMFMMAIAGWVQKSFSDDGLIEKFIGAELLLATLGAISPIAIYAAFGYLENHFRLILYFFVLSIGFLIGLEIPLATRINHKYAKSLKHNIASIWSFDYVGSLLGSLLFALFLIKVFPITRISFLVALVNVIVALVTLIFFHRNGLVKKKAIMYFSLIVCFLILIWGYANSTAINQSLEQKLYRDPIVLEKTTKYQRLVMTHNKVIDEYRFYINGNLQFSSIDEGIYHEQLVHPAMSIVQDHEKVLVLGGGDGLALREIMKYDVEKVVLVDIDKEMVRIAAEDPIFKKLNQNAFDDARITVETADIETGETQTLFKKDGTKYEQIAQINAIIIDADKFVSDTRDKWDVIIIDLPDPSSIELAKLYSKEFYIKLYKILSENGVIAVQSTSPIHSKKTFNCIAQTLSAAGFETIKYHDHVPSFGEWGWIIASKKEIDTDVEILVETDYLTSEVFSKAQVFGKGSEINVTVNTLMHPVILNYYLDESWYDE